MNNNKTILLIEELTIFLPLLRKKVKYISSGGCAMFAYLLWKKLISLGYTNIIAREIVYPEGADLIQDDEEFLAYNTKGTVNRLIKTLRENGEDLRNRYDHEWRHILLEIDNKDHHIFLIDSDNIISTLGPIEDKSLSILRGKHYPNNDIVGEKILFEDLEILALDKSILWNDIFDKNQIPEMEEMINELV